MKIALLEIQLTHAELHSTFVACKNRIDNLNKLADAHPTQEAELRIEANHLSIVLEKLTAAYRLRLRHKSRKLIK